MRDFINLFVDPDSFSEYKAEYGQTIVCGYARIGGFTVGIVANQRTTVTTKKEGMQFGGVIYHDSADKEARFIMDCNQNWTPIIFLQDVNGFMVGKRQRSRPGSSARVPRWSMRSPTAACPRSR